MDPGRIGRGRRNGRGLACALVPAEGQRPICAEPEKILASSEIDPRPTETATDEAFRARRGSIGNTKAVRRYLLRRAFSQAGGTLQRQAPPRSCRLSALRRNPRTTALLSLSKGQRP